MRKTILLTILASLILMPGCSTQSGNNPENPGSKKESKGYVYVRFATEGLARDIVSMKVLINGEQEALLGTTDTEFTSKDIDITKAVTVVIEPVFTEVEAPAENFDFGYSYSYKVAVTSDGGKSYSSIQTDSEDKSMRGIKADAFESTVERTKERLKKVTFTIENGEVK